MEQALLLHIGVGQVLPVDDHVRVVRGLQGEAPVADAAAITLLLVHVHDVLQVLLPSAKGQLGNEPIVNGRGKMSSGTAMSR